MYTCRISVHELVETSYLQGSLTSQGMSAQRAQLGARIHRMLQGQRGKNYQSEVFFRHESVLDDITIIVEGRADGIEITDGEILVEEIKSTLLPVEQIDDSIFVHFAQCYVYAHFCLLQHPEQEEIVTRVTYVQAKSGQEKHFERTLSRSELDAFYAQLLDNYRRWAAPRSAHQRQSEHKGAAIPLSQLSGPPAGIRGLGLSDDHQCVLSHRAGAHRHRQDHLDLVSRPQGAGRRKM